MSAKKQGSSAPKVKALKNTKVTKTLQKEEQQELKPKKAPKQTAMTDYVDVKAQNKAITGDGKFDKTKISITNWNLNGLRAVEKNNSLTNFLQKFSPDILCINELKVDKQDYEKEQLHKFIPKGYTPYLNFVKPPKKGYSGVGILTKYLPINVTYDLGIPKHDQEGRMITLEFDKFFLVCTYVPNAGQKLERLGYRTKEWDQDFRQQMLELKKKKHVIWTGDLNVAHNEIDISNPEGNRRSAGFTIEERTEFSNFLKTGFVDTFREQNPKKVQYSYFSYRSNARASNKGWRLDYFVVDNDLYKKGACLDSTINNEVMGSDHCPIDLVLDISKI